MFPNNLLAITGRRNKQRKSHVFTCPTHSTGEVTVKGGILVHLLELSVSNGLPGHPPSELPGKPPSMSLLFSFAVFPSETLLICIKPTCSL